MRGYLAHVEIERGLSPNTVAAYRRDLERYVLWCDQAGLLNVEDITQNDVSDFASSLASGSPDAAPLSASSAARTMVSVRTFHRFIAREGVAPEDPAAHVRPPAIPKRLPKALPYEDVETEPVHLPDRIFNPDYERKVLPDELYVPKVF